MTPRSRQSTLTPFPGVNKKQPDSASTVSGPFTYSLICNNQIGDNVISGYLDISLTRIGLLQIGLCKNSFVGPGRGVRVLIAFAPLCSALLLFGCAYSFTGASVPPHLKTVGIPLVDDRSGFGEAGLREQFTTELTNLFIADNSLQVGDRTTSDALLQGAITSVTDAPSVVQQGEQVSKRRITVTVSFTFQDMKLRKKVWEKTFSNWGDYDSGGGLSQRQTGLTEAIRKISEDILLETVSGW